MKKYETITIKEAMANISSNKYLLPAIQRNFVWSMEQIETLFDSILRGFPINSFMLWNVTSQEIKNDFVFYTFIKDYAKKYREINPKISTKLLGGDFYAVIDGQQRLTSIYIALDGSYRIKKPNKRWRYSEETMPTRKFYLEITEPLNVVVDNEKKYNFRFLSKDDLNNDISKNPTHYWFKVGDVYNLNSKQQIKDFLKSKKLDKNKFAFSTLNNLVNKVNTDKIINIYNITEQDEDRVLNIFIRTNSGGTALSFSDLLMSISSANWEKYDAREEIKDARDQIYKFGNPCFDVSQDFILKSILVLSGSDVKFKLSNFEKGNIGKFENNWPDIKKSLISTFELLEQLGFNDYVLRAKNATIPIAYYIYKNNLADEIIKTTYNQDDKRNISRWLSMSLLKGIFGGQSDGVLTSIRDVLSTTKSKKFPIEEIFDKFKTNPDKNYSFDNAVIESFVFAEYGSATSKLVLGLLYPDVLLAYGSAVVEDHMHPRIQFEDKEKLSALSLSKDDEKFFIDKQNYNTVVNLQLMEDSKNKSKGDDDLATWATNMKKLRKDLFVNDSTSLSIKDFEQFIKDRKSVLINELKKVLKV